VYDVVGELEPDLVVRTRVIRRSEQLGFPPIACRQQALATPAIKALAEALRSMQASADGKAILGILRLDGFADAEPSLFDGIAAKFAAVRSQA
jgi:phosphonate transport system substrate-binding protein